MRTRTIVLALIVSILLVLTVGTVSASASGGCQKHYVKWGETLYSIGRKYDVAPYAIAAYNGFSDPDYIKGGIVVCVPYGPPYPGSYYGYPSHSPKIHYVHEGETLYSIGRHYNVDPYAIARANHLYNPDYVKMGTKIYIPSGPPYPGYDYYKHQYGYKHDYGYKYDYGYKHDYGGYDGYGMGYGYHDGDQVGYGYHGGY